MVKDLGSAEVEQLVAFLRKMLHKDPTRVTCESWRVS